MSRSTRVAGTGPGELAALEPAEQGLALWRASTTPARRRDRGPAHRRSRPGRARRSRRPRPRRAGRARLRQRASPRRRRRLRRAQARREGAGDCARSGRRRCCRRRSSAGDAGARRPRSLRAADLEPGPRPAHAVAAHQRRHRRERGDAAAAQRLQQEGLGLVAAMVAEQHEVDAALDRHLAQRPIARAARPGLDAVAGGRSCGDAMDGELDRLAAARPAAAALGAMRLPGVGVLAQPVMDVQREDREAERLRGGERRVEQRRRVAPAAVGDGDDARAPGSRQRAVVSLKRP